MDWSGVRQGGYWAMLRLNTAWSGYTATMVAIQAAGVLREVENPESVFA
jgi:hypothetical protein